jgi:hypothetical protein
MDSKMLPYRIGWPELPPLPVTTITDGARHEVEDTVKHLQTVKDILMAQGISSSEVYFAYRIPRYANPEEHHNFLTLVITADTTTNFTIRLAVVQIRQHLKKFEDTSNVAIEVLDFRAVDGLNTFPIHFTERIILEEWPRVLEQVISELDRRKAAWMCIELAHRGILDEVHRCTPTVVITSPTAAERIWWTTLLPALRARTRSGTNLEFEVLFGDNIFGSLTHEAGDTVTQDSYNAEVLMGASIGFAG